MSARNSSGRTAQSKPDKPYADYPLFAHAAGVWAKKIRGKLHYFGKWDDADAALKKYLAEKEALHAGRTPDYTSEQLTMFVLCGKFLTTKKRMLDAGELSIRSYTDYAAVCKRLIKAFGKGRLVSDLRPDDFEKLRAAMAKKWGPVRLGNEINRTRIVFNYAWKSGLLEKPMLYGEGFARPSKKTLRKHRQSQGPKMFEADEIRRLLGMPPWRPAAGEQLTAMILLGINCAFGNADLGTLPLTALDPEGSWINYPRPKTGVERRCPLWPETVTALRAWLKQRKQPMAKADAGLVFVTKYGHGWGKDTSDSPISKEMRKLLDDLEIEGHRNFYALRHTFQTIGDECGDFLAVRAIMGHADSDISAQYRERISDERLRKVTEYVRGWVFGKAMPG